MKAVLYPRVSSLKQLDGTSLEVQENACRQWCEQKGYKVEKVFLEKGESAKTADRTQLKAALAYVEAKGDIDVFVVHKLDRAARQSLDYHMLVMTLKASGCKLISATEPFDNDTPSGRFMGGILALQAQFDNEVRTERCKTGMTEALKRGCWMWTAPVGFKTGRTEDGQATLYHDPIMAPVVRKLFELFASGTVSQTEITKLSAKMGLLTTNGKPLSKQSIKNMLTNPVYAARIRTKLIKGERNGNWKPIVPGELFDRVQNILCKSKRQNIKHIKIRPEFILKGFLHCAKCGRKMTAYESTGKLGKKYPYYGCPKCRGQSISLVKMVEEFEALIDLLQMPKDYFENLRTVVKKELAQAGKKTTELERAKLNAKIKLKREQEKLLDYLMRGTIDDETYDSRLKKLRSEVAELDNEIMSRDFEFQDIDATLKYARRVLLEPRTFWAKSNNDTKIQLQTIWCPQGLVFDKSKRVRTRLTINTPTPYSEDVGAVKCWYTRRDSNPRPPD